MMNECYVLFEKSKTSGGGFWMNIKSSNNVDRLVQELERLKNNNSDKSYKIMQGNFVVTIQL